MELYKSPFAMFTVSVGWGPEHDSGLMAPLCLRPQLQCEESGKSDSSDGPLTHTPGAADGGPQNAPVRALP